MQKDWTDADFIKVCDAYLGAVDKFKNDFGVIGFYDANNVSIQYREEDFRRLFGGESNPLTLAVTAHNCKDYPIKVSVKLYGIEHFTIKRL